MAYARVTKFKMKSGSIDEALIRMEGLKEKILSQPGVLQFINVANDDGTGYVISILESKEIAEANTKSLMAIWAAFADLLEGTPTPEGYELRANWP